MVALPEESPVTMEDLARWYKLQAELGKLKAQEALLRPIIFKHFFPGAHEGVNDYPLPVDPNDPNAVPYVLKGTRKIERKIDLPVYYNYSKEWIDPETGQVFPNQFAAKGIKIDELVEFKPELRVGAYKKLPPEQRAFMDQALNIKDATPSMEIKPLSDRARSKAIIAKLNGE